MSSLYTDKIVSDVHNYVRPHFTARGAGDPLATLPAACAAPVWSLGYVGGGGCGCALPASCDIRIGGGVAKAAPEPPPAIIDGTPSAANIWGGSNPLMLCIPYTVRMALHLVNQCDF
jgi:hypothetical protein